MSFALNNNKGGSGKKNKKKGGNQAGFASGSCDIPDVEKWEPKHELDLGGEFDIPKVEDELKETEDNGYETPALRMSSKKKDISMPENNKTGLKPPVLDTKPNKPKLEDTKPRPKPKRKSHHPILPVTIDTSDPTIRLTPDNHTFVFVHRGLLTQSSTYFTAHFSHSYSNTIDFSHSGFSITPSIDVLKAYSQWLYTGIISLSSNKFECLARAHVFGEQVQHHDFCNAVMSEFIRLHMRTQALAFDHIIELVYKHTEPSSTMRKLLADMYAWNLEVEPGLEDVLRELPKEFLVDVLAAMVRVRGTRSEEWWMWLDGEGEGYYVDDGGDAEY